MYRFHVPPAFGNEFLYHAIDDSVDVFRDLLRTEVTQPDPHARRSRWAQVYQRAAYRTLDLLCALRWRRYAFTVIFSRLFISLYDD